MAPLPQNTTARVFFDYVTGTQPYSKRHTLAIRSAGQGESVDAVQDLMLAFLQGISASNLKTGWKIEAVRLQNAGSDFSLPVVPIPGIAAFVGTSAASWEENREAVEWTWQGRSYTSGRRVDFSLYGLGVAPATNLRLVGGGSGVPAWVLTTVNILNNRALYPWGPVTIDGSVATWYGYVNCNYNSYWETQIRRG